MAELESVLAQAKALPVGQQQLLRASLPPPTAGGLNRVWYLLIAGLLLIALVALGGAMWLTFKGKTADASWAVVTAVVGGLVGLLAPSPTQTGTNS
jgi:hypothetical protein